jgi:hypothetical protein
MERAGNGLAGELEVRARRWVRGARWVGALTALSLVVAACSGSKANGPKDSSPEGGAGNEGGGNGTANASGNGAEAGAGALGSGGVRDIDDLEVDPAPEAAWTIVVYGHGDHNLSNSLLNDLGEMARAELGAPGNVNVLALTDWDASQAIAGTDPPEPFPEGVQLFRIPGGGRELQLIAEGPEANLDDPQVLTQLVSSVFSAFPARRRAVILWDHGGAWNGGFGSDTQNGTVSAPTPMPAQAVPAAIADGLASAGITDAPPLDIVAFDTCLMAGAEVVFPFRDLARAYIANAEIDYGNGWDYTTTLSYIAAHAEDDALDLAKAEVEQWDQHHVEASANDALLRSHVAIDLSKVEAFGAATKALTSLMTTSETYSALSTARSGFFALPPYASQIEGGQSSLPGLRDAGQILTALSSSSSEPELVDAARGARAALDDMLLASSQGNLRQASLQAGLHLELGAAAELSSVLPSYTKRASVWSKASGWGTALQQLVAQADDVAPRFEHAMPNAAGVSLAARATLELTTLDTDTAKGAVQLGMLIDADTVAYLGIIGSGVLDGQGQYSYEWDGTAATFPDGQLAMLSVWLDLPEETNDLVLSTPGVLNAGGEALEAQLVFSAAEESASAAIVTLNGVSSTLALAEIAQAFPGATFTPLYVGISVSSGESGPLLGDPMEIPSDGTFVFDTTFMQAGSYYLFTSITDVWGNESVEADTFELLEPLGE